MAAGAAKKSFKDRFLGGVAWTGVTQAAAQAGQFFLTAFLAHVLTPDDFGLIALCFVVTGTTAVLREIGLPQAVVQLRHLRPGHQNSAFWATVAISLVLTAAAFAAAGPLAALLGEARVAPILRLMSLGLIVSSLGLIPAALLTRAMDFRRLGLCDLGQVIGGASVALPLAWHGFGVWSLAFGFLAGDVSRTVLTFWFARWRPGVRFSKAEVGALFRFGLGITGSSMFYALRAYVDKFLVGRFLGVAALGGYSLAFRIMSVPQQRMSWLISRVTFAGFSSIQDDAARIRRIYAKTLKLIALAAAPPLAILAVAADDFVGLVYGPQWIFMIPALRIMCLAGICYAVGTTVGPVIMARGRSGLLFLLSAVLTALLTAAVLVGLRFGLEGAAVALGAQAVVGYGFGFFLVLRLLRMRGREFLGAFRTPAAVAALAGADAFVAREISGLEAGPLRLAATVGAGVVVYVLAVWFARVPELAELKTHLVEKFRARRPVDRDKLLREARS